MSSRGLVGEEDSSALPAQCRFCTGRWSDEREGLLPAPPGMRPQPTWAAGAEGAPSGCTHPEESPCSTVLGEGRLMTPAVAHMPQKLADYNGGLVHFPELVFFHLLCRDLK